MLHGEPSSYEGRQSFGTGEGSLIDHIKRLNTLCNENPQWENYLLETGGSDALLQDRHEKEYILNEFIPYLNLHVTLSEIEQSVSEKLTKEGLRHGKEAKQSDRKSDTDRQYAKDPEKQRPPARRLLHGLPEGSPRSAESINGKRCRGGPE